MEIPWYLAVPFLTAGLYAAASLFFKQAYARGLGMKEAFYWLNLTGMVLFSPLLLTVEHWPVAAEWWKPLVTAMLIYLGTWTTFAAIRAGDVSLVTPLMGTKVVLTATLATVLAGTHLSAGLWAAAVLTSVGILVLGWKDLRQGRGKGRAVGWCLLSSSIFAGADVLIGHWAGPFGRAAFLGTAFTAIGAGSLITYKWLAPGMFAVPRAAWSGTALGAVLMTVNTLAMALCIAGFNDPTGINVVYGTRGLWSLGLVWYVGSRWFGNEERADSKGSMGLRLVGSLLILAAVAVAVAAQGRVG